MRNFFSRWICLGCLRRSHTYRLRLALQPFLLGDVRRPLSFSKLIKTPLFIWCRIKGCGIWLLTSVLYLALYSNDWTCMFRFLFLCLLIWFYIFPCHFRILAQSFYKVSLKLLPWLKLKPLYIIFPLSSTHRWFLIVLLYFGCIYHSVLVSLKYSLRGWFALINISLNNCGPLCRNAFLTLWVKNLPLDIYRF